MYLTRLNSLEGFENYVSAKGANPIELLRQVGLTSAQLREPNNYCAYATVAEALELAAVACNEPLFGLGLAQAQTLGIVRDLVLTISQQPTLASALELTNRYAYLQAGGVSVITHIAGERCRLEFESQASSRLGLNQKILLSVGQLGKLVVHLMGLEKPTFPLCVRQAAPANTALPPDLVARVRFRADFNGLEIPSSWLNRAPRHDSDAVRVHFETLITELQAHYPDSLEDQVRSIIGSLLPTGECTVDNVARSLGMTARTLQKRLKEASYSFSALLHEVRAAIAKQHLASPDTSVTKLAFHLGYADVAVFSRQFRGWTGVSPREWQKGAAQ